MIQGDDSRILARCIDAGVKIFLALDHAVNNICGACGITNPPPRHSVSFRETVDDDGSFLHARQRGYGSIRRRVIINQCVVHFVSDDKNVVPLDYGCNFSTWLQGITPPAGLLGELIMSAFVLGVIRD